MEEQRRGHLAGAEWAKEREGGGQGWEGMGQVVQSLGDHREDLDFDPREDGGEWNT